MRWLRRLLRRKQMDDRLEQELRFHLEQHTEELIAQGLDAVEARRRARLALGGPEQVKEQCRDVRGTRWLEELAQDLRHAFRALRQNPGFAVAVLATLALGIGANAAVFSVVNAVLLKPLPLPSAGRVVQFEATYGATEDPIASPRGLNTRRRETSAFEDVSAYWLDHVNLTAGSGDAALVPAAVVTADFFRLTGAPLLYGRTFTGDEDRPGGGHVAVLSYTAWAGRFGADPQLLGKTISLGEVPYTVVGVLGRFDPGLFDQPPELWIPFQIDPSGKQVDSRLCYIAGRLKPGITLAMARAELKLQDAADRRAGSMRATDGSTVEPLRDALTGDVRPSLLILVGAVGLVLLIACANVASLLLVRTDGRMREFAVRAALGARRGRIIRQLLAESLLLSWGGGALGLALGWAGMRALLALYPTTPLGAAIVPVSIPRIGEAGAAVTLDWRVLLFTAVATLFAAVLFSAIPALHLFHTNLNDPLKNGSGAAPAAFGRITPLSLLVACEMTLAVVLLTGSGLLIRSFTALREVDPGFDSHRVLTMQTSLANSRFAQASAAGQLTSSGVERIQAIPGVESAAVSCCLPLETAWQLPYIVQGRPLAGKFHGFAGWTFVSSEYFDVLRIPVLRGRAFTTRDTAGAPGVVIVNQTMARLVWPQGGALHQRLLLGRTFGPQYEADPEREVVGIVGDVRDQGLHRKPRPIMYVPLAQVPEGVQAIDFPLLPVAWLVRTRENPLVLADAVSKQVQIAAGGLPVARVRSLDQVSAQSTARSRFNTVLMGVFGFAALLLAAIGMYGLIAYSVNRRVREIGIRVALGARPADVLRTVLLQGLRLILAGLAAGIPLAFALARLLANLLFGITARDPEVFVGVPALLMIVAVLAIWLPARRASRIDPLTALREE